MTRLTILLYFLLAALSLPTLEASNTVKPYLRRDVSNQQWTYFERQAKRWRGLWLRINSTGHVFASTKMKRFFNKVTGGQNGLPAYLQTVEYSNLNWSASGVSKRQFLYIKTDPPTWGSVVLPNGSIETRPILGNIGFFPYSCGHYAGGSVAKIPSAVHFTESFIANPWNPRARIALSAVYLGGRFSYVAAAREVAGSTKFPSAPWKGGKVVDIITSTKPLPGPWTEVTSCLNEPSHIYERYVRVLDHDIKAFPSGPEFVTLRIRDGSILMAYPVEFIALSGERDVKIYEQWKISTNGFARVELTFAPNGTLKRDCVSIYQRVTGLV